MVLRVGDDLAVDGMAAGREAMSSEAQHAREEFPLDPGPVRHAVLEAFVNNGMITVAHDRLVAVCSLAHLLRHLGEGHWLEEYTALTLRDFHFRNVGARRLTGL